MPKTKTKDVVAELTAKIKSVSSEMLGQQSIPESELTYLRNYKIFPIELLVKADWNYKQEDEYKSDKLRNNIKRIGQVENVQVRLLPTGYYEVVNGNHRLDDMIALGKKWVMAYDHGPISQIEAKRIAIETNETRFPHDIAALGNLLKDLDDFYGHDNLDTTMPFTPDEYQDLIHIPEFDFSQYNERLSPDELDQKKADRKKAQQQQQQFTISCAPEEYAPIRAALQRLAQKFDTMHIED